jgi:ABC-type lipoprotein export system ATPase subunit
MPIIELRNVTKTYSQTATSDPVQVLRDLTLSVEPGQSLAITGPSGSGKSTLLNIIGGLDQATEGTVTVDGKDVSTLQPREAAAFRAGTVGFIFQHHHLLPQAGALENVLLPHLAKDAPQLQEDPRDRARALLEKVGLKERLHHKPSALSGGERLRCATARALMNKPRLLLADEPTGSLDSRNAADIMDLLLRINEQENLTLVVVTHSLDIARRLQRHETLNLGRLEAAEQAPAAS